ncbi:MAG: hypothetical protein HN849_30025 [Victivallales bacterium]|nr:hypothetical protein [Victivallales bacterium]
MPAPEKRRRLAAPNAAVTVISSPSLRSPPNTRRAVMLSSMWELAATPLDDPVVPRYLHG